MLRAYIAILSVAAPAFAQREFGFDNTKSSGQPYLSPEESVKRMKVADGFEVKLFAAEPQIVNPIAMTVDEKGRVWIVESFEYPKRTPKGKMPRDRIKILESTKGDGVCDKVTTFIEGKDFPVPFDMASGIEVGNGGVYLGAPPYLFFIENKNDKPGKIEILLKGFGSQDTHETLNTFQWGPDGRLYGLHGVFTYSEVKPAQADGPGTRMNAAVWRFDTKTKKFEVFAEGTSNPWGMDWRNTDGQFILCCCVIPHLFHMVPGGNYKRQGGVPSNPYAYGEIKEICDHTFHKESGWAHAGLISLDTPIMPEKYRNSVIFGSIHGCSIKQNILKPNGSSFTASRADDFLVSGDKNFRPVNLRWGHNGEIYCIDWHDQHPCHQTNPDDWDYEHGRVYRIQPKGLKTKVAENLAKRSKEDLTEMVSADNPYESRTAARLLAERGLGVDDPLVGKLAQRSGNDIRAFWAMTNAVHSATPPLPAHDDPAVRAAQVRTWACRSEQQRISDSDFDLLAKLAVTEQSPRVRQELASAAIKLIDLTYGYRLLYALERHKQDASDPVIPHLLWLSHEIAIARDSRREVAWLRNNAIGNPLITDTIVPRAMRRLIATGKREDVGLCVAFIGDVVDSGVRAKALDALVSAIGNRTVDAPHEWDAVHPKLEKDTNADVKRLTNSLAVKFRDSAAIHRAMAVAGDSSKQTPERLAALRDLVVVRSPSTAPFLLELVRGKDDAELKAEAIRALGNIDLPKISADLLAESEKLSPPLRNEVVQVLAGRRDWANDLLAAVGSKKVDRTALNDNTILRIQALNDKRLNAQIEKVWGRMRATPAELNQLIDKMRGELAKAPGSFDRGKIVFDNQCAKCHKFDGRGHEVGPNIEGAGRDIEYLLTNVLDPNRVIGAPYFMRTITLLNMRTEVGILAAEDDTSITLKTENGVLKQFQKKDIDDIKVQEKSLMPEGLDKNMSVDNFRDLVRYVMANPFITNVEVNKSYPVVGVSGRIPLPEGQVTLTAKVIVPAGMTIRLLVGCKTDFEVNGVTGKGGAGEVRPDQTAVEVILHKGENALTLRTKASKGDAVYLRFQDPERKLRYPEK